MKYVVELEEVTLEEAVELIDKKLNVFYAYEIGKPVWKLDKETLFTAVRGKAIYLTPCSFLEKKE